MQRREPLYASDVERPTRALSRFMLGIRLDEVLVLQGSPLLGAAFAMGHATPGKMARLAVFLVASCCLVAHIFVLNDWSELNDDSVAPDGKVEPALASILGRRETEFLWLGLLLVSLLLFGLLGLRTVSIAIAIAILSAMYSAPVCHAKGIPVLNSTLHLVGGVLHFLLGYSLYGAVDLRAVEIGCFFALTFVAGHLMQEVRDHDEDLIHDIKTNAVSFGKFRSFAAGLVIFTLADVLLLLLVTQRVVPRAFALIAGLYPFHLYWSVRAMGDGLTSEGVRRLQWRYRALYAALGVAAAAALLAGR